MWDYLGRTSDAISLLTFVVAAATAVMVWRRQKHLHRLAVEHMESDSSIEGKIEAHKGIRSPKPMALAVSLVPNNHSIRGDVQRFLNASCLTMPIDEINFRGIANQADRVDYIKQLNKKRLDCERDEITELHVFFQGPVPAAIQLGAIFRNWLPVKLYHKPQPATTMVYEYWMPLL